MFGLVTPKVPQHLSGKNFRIYGLFVSVAKFVSSSNTMFACKGFKYEESNCKNSTATVGRDFNGDSNVTVVVKDGKDNALTDMQTFRFDHKVQNDVRTCSEVSRGFGASTLAYQLLMEREHKNSSRWYNEPSRVELSRRHQKTKTKKRATRKNSLFQRDERGYRQTSLLEWFGTEPPTSAPTSNGLSLSATTTAVNPAVAPGNTSPNVKIQISLKVETPRRGGGNKKTPKVQSTRASSMPKGKRKVCTCACTCNLKTETTRVSNAASNPSQLASSSIPQLRTLAEDEKIMLVDKVQEWLEGIQARRRLIKSKETSRKSVDSRKIVPAKAPDSKASLIYADLHPRLQAFIAEAQRSAASVPPLDVKHKKDLLKRPSRKQRRPMTTYHIRCGSMCRKGRSPSESKKAIQNIFDSVSVGVEGNSPNADPSSSGSVRPETGNGERAGSATPLVD